MASVLVPVLYLIAIFGGLFIFGRFYMGRHAAKGTEPYFPRHTDRDVYVSLLSLDPPAPEALLKAALLRRAMADVNRIMRLREDKPALQQLLQKGLIGEELWTSLLTAEKELETEILEVQAEANTFLEGWGQIIFNTAGELVAQEKIQTIFRSVPKMRIDFETKYNRKVKGINISALPPNMLPPGVRPGTPGAVPRPPAPTSVPGSPVPAPASPAPSTPKSQTSTLVPPSSANSTLSDSEGPSSPSKSPSKKSKKRK